MDFNRGFTFRRFTVLILFWGMVFTGCSSGDRPPLGKVEGTVKLNGKPLPLAKIYFDPISKGRSSTAVSDESGHYVLEYSLDAGGAKVGEHAVRLSSAWREGENPDHPEARNETVPEKYRGKGGLTVEVKRGANTIDLNLESH